MESEIQRLLGAALRHHQTGALAQAEALYRQILSIAADQPDALHLMGVLAHQAGRQQEAAELIGRALSINSKVPAFHNNLGNVHKALRRFQEAESSYRAAHALKPSPEVQVNLASVLLSQGKLEEAEVHLRQALLHRPKSGEIYLELGNLNAARERYAEAESDYRTAQTLKPGIKGASVNLGNVLKFQGRMAEAAEAYRSVPNGHGDFADALYNLGIVQLDLGESEQAVDSLEKALARRGESPETLAALGHALRESGRPSDAVAIYRRALAVDGDCAPARLGLALAAIPVVADSAEQSLNAVSGFLEGLNKLARWGEGNLRSLGKIVGTQQPFNLAYRPQDVTGALQNYGELLSCAAQARWSPDIAPADPGSRIRLLIVCAQVRRHPVFDVILKGILANLDRARFEVVLYHTAALVDAETDWASSKVDAFVQGPKSVESWVAKVRELRPEVIFYPEVGMDGVSCALASLRLAPVQAASWGHPVTTGMPHIDCFLSGDFLEGENADAHYCESLVRLPRTGVCLQPGLASAQVWSGPKRQQGIVRYALCQQPIKLDPEDDELFASIARVSAPCEIWLAMPRRQAWTSARVRARMERAFRAQGVDPDQCLKVTPWLREEEFLGFLDAMDIFLDSPAFSGFTTAWQALQRGLPIITLEGAFLRQRLAAGLLRQAGVGEGIVPSREEYLATAARWASMVRQESDWRVRREGFKARAATLKDDRSVVTAFADALAAAVDRARKAGQVGRP